MSGQQQGSLILKSGLNEVYDTGVYPNFALKYFLPVYDSRLDLEIHDLPLTTPTSALQNSASVLNVDAASSAFSFGDIEGELLWKYDTLAPTYEYRIDYTGNILTNATADPTGTMSAVTTLNSKLAQANFLYNTATSAELGRPHIGTPFSSAFEHYTADNVTSSGDGNFTSTSNFTTVSQVDTVPSDWLATNLYSNISYISNEGNPDNYGVYQLRLPANTGSFRFNKLVLFGQKVDIQGDDEVGSNPFPFAVVTLNNAQTKLSSTDPNNSNNVTEFIADIALAFTRSTSGASEISYNPEEYWTRIKTVSDGTSALEYPGSVLISPIDGGINEESPKSKLHVIEGDTSKEIIRFSRQESSNGNDGVISINPNTSSIKFYTEEAARGFEFNATAAATDAGALAIGPNTSAAGAYSLFHGDNLSMVVGSFPYYSIRGSNTTLLGAPPGTMGSINVLECGTVNSFGGILNASNINTNTAILTSLNSIYNINNVGLPEHTGHSVSDSIVNSSLQALSNINYNTSISTTVGATTSGTKISSSLIIGDSSNYDDVHQSITVGNNWSFQGPVVSSIIVGTKPNQFDPPVAGAGHFSTSGSLILSSQQPPSILYNVGYQSCFIMGDGHIVGGGLQSTSAIDRNSMFTFGFGNMIACDYSMNVGYSNTMNSAPTQTDYTDEYKYNFNFGAFNRQDGVHATSGYDFIKGTYTFGARIYTEDTKGVFVFGGNDFDTLGGATQGNNDNDIRRAVNTYVMGGANTLADISDSFINGKANTTFKTTTDNRSIFGNGTAFLWNSAIEAYNWGSAHTNTRSFNTYLMGSSLNATDTNSVFLFGSATLAVYTDNSISIGNSNGFQGNSGGLIDNCYTFGRANTILNYSVNNGYMVGYNNTISLSVGSQSNDVFLFGKNNSHQNEDKDDYYAFGNANANQGTGSHSYSYGRSNFTEDASNAYSFGYNNSITDFSTNTFAFGDDNEAHNTDDAFLFGNLNEIWGLGPVNYAIGDSNVTSGSTSTFVVGKSNAITSASGAYVLGNSCSTNKDGDSATLNDNYMIGNSNTLVTGSIGKVDNSYIFGVSNSFTSNSTMQDGTINACFAIGVSNLIDSKGGASPSPNIDNSIAIGTLNIIEANAYADMQNDTIIGYSNDVNVTGSASDTTFSGVQVLGAENHLTIASSVHDVTVRNENNVTVIGTNGDISDFTAISKLFKIWDDVSPGNTYATNTDAIGGGNEVNNTLNVLITNGNTGGPGDIYKANAIGIGNMDTGISLFRQIIVLPIKTSVVAGGNMTNNPLNPSNPEYSIPTFDEVESMLAAGKRPPMGTLIYDDGTPNTLPASASTPLHVFLGQ
jgi:hypothetical protein